MCGVVIVTTYLLEVRCRVWIIFNIRWIVEITWANVFTLSAFNYILKLYNDENLAASYIIWTSQLFHLAKCTFGWLNGNLFSRGVIFYNFTIVGSSRWLTIFKFNQTSHLTFLSMGDYYCVVSISKLTIEICNIKMENSA